MPRSLTKLLSIAPGEERKTALLYSLHFLFYLGLMWGNAVLDPLFFGAQWTKDDLSLVFVAYAILGFTIGALYAFVADRISNGLLLKIIMGVMVVWLVSVRVLLVTNGGTRGMVYPYFYLAYSAFSDLSTMHILTYINDFYDTRAAKRALPLMLSAGIGGGALAGITISLLNKLVGMQNTPLVWAACIVGCFILIVVIERQLSGDLEQIERHRLQATTARTTDKKAKQGGLYNMREGFDYVRKSGLLRGLAVATFAMVVLMTLLRIQASSVIASQFPNNPDGMSAFLGNLSAVSSVGGLLIQSLFLGRLVNWLGVGTMNLFFPLVTLGSVAAISVAPNMVTGSFARLDHSAIKQTFRNPLDAMLYNSVPVRNKARARGFVNGVIVPAGTLLAGLLGMAVKFQILTGPILVEIGLGVAVLYLLVMFNVRREYARAMTSLLAGDEIAIFRQDQSEALPPDPATLKWLRQKLESLPADVSADGQAIFISQVLYDMDAHKTLPLMFDMAKKRGSFFLKGMIEFLDKANLEQVEFIRLCQRSLDDPEPVVREAAATALLNFLKRESKNQSAVLPRESLLNSLYACLGELQLEEQAQLVILLLRSGSPGQKSHALTLLESWLATAEMDRSANNENNAPVLEAGLIVLAETERQGMKDLFGSSLDQSAIQRKIGRQPSRLKDLVRIMLDHPDPYVRHQVIPALAREGRLAHWDSEHWAVQNLVRLLEDPEENIRLAVIEELQGDIETMSLKPVLWQALNDPGLDVRRSACKLPILLKRAEMRALWECLEANAIQSAPNRAESAAYLLIRANQSGANAALGRTADALVRDSFWLALQGLALKELAQSDSQPRPGARLMANAFQEASLSVLEEVFWLMSANSSEEEIQAVRRALPSSDPSERANAAEALEAGLPPATARQLRRLLDGSSDEDIIACAGQELGLRKPSLTQVIHSAWPQLNPENTVLVVPRRLQSFYSDGLLATTAIYLLTETRLSGRAELDISIPAGTVRKALLHTLETDARPTVKEAAATALNQLDASEKEVPMSTDQPLTLIEKIIFLKEVPFFSELPLREISILAGISEEASYPADQKIFSQGDTTKSLYLIIKGRVSVQQQTRTGSIVRLTALGAKNYFAETSLFDGAPHQADIVTIDPTDILLIRQSTLFTLIRRRPDIGLSLLKVLSQRLRETYAQVAQNERAKPQKLMSLFDKLEE
jgi:CRP-like cAMP-binding protein/HEAT repeat protein